MLCWLGLTCQLSSLSLLRAWCVRCHVRVCMAHALSSSLWLLVVVACVVFVQWCRLHVSLSVRPSVCLRLSVDDFHVAASQLQFTLHARSTLQGRLVNGAHGLLSSLLRGL